MTIVQSSLEHQPRHSQEATLKTGVSGGSCSSGDWEGEGEQREADSFILIQGSFSARSVHKRHTPKVSVGQASLS